MNKDELKIFSDLSSENGYHAIKAIQAYLQEGEPIPAELSHWVNEACNAWLELRGAKSKKQRTKNKWLQRVITVRQKHSFEDLTIDKAKEEVCKEEKAKGYKCSKDALDRAYKKYNSKAKKMVKDSIIN